MKKNKVNNNNKYQNYKINYNSIKMDLTEETLIDNA